MKKEFSLFVLVFLLIAEAKCLETMVSEKYNDGSERVKFLVKSHQLIPQYIENFLKKYPSDIQKDKIERDVDGKILIIKQDINLLKEIRRLENSDNKRDSFEGESLIELYKVYEKLKKYEKYVEYSDELIDKELDKLKEKIYLKCLKKGVFLNLLEELGNRMQLIAIGTTYLGNQKLFEPLKELVTPLIEVVLRNQSFFVNNSDHWHYRSLVEKIEEIKELSPKKMFKDACQFGKFYKLSSSSVFYTNLCRYHGSEGFEVAKGVLLKSLEMIKEIKFGENISINKDPKLFSPDAVLNKCRFKYKVGDLSVFMSDVAITMIISNNDNDQNVIGFTNQEFSEDAFISLGSNTEYGEVFETVIGNIKKYGLSNKLKNDLKGLFDIVTNDVNTSVRIFHPISKDKDPILKNSRLFFLRASEWDGSDIEELKELVGTLHWNLSQGRFFSRGSADIAEWIIEALYHQHGYIAKLKTWKKVDNHALVMPLKLFLEDYKKDIVLSKGNPPQKQWSKKIEFLP